MVRQIFELWKSERKQKGTTLHRRLVLFFVLVSVSLILAFTLMMTLFGITGKGEKALHEDIDSELSRISGAISEDFGRLSVEGINLAEYISDRSDHFFAENGISASQLQTSPELLEPFLAEHIQLLLATVSSRSCGGAFILLDATVNPESEGADTAKAGIFIKKTQPESTGAVGVKLHYLRGPAQIARDNGIELLGQWRMEYDVAGQEFFSDVMETARSNPDTPLSRLYYWTGRVTLKDNSEAGFLLCVPLRSRDGTVFGVCGIEVSDRMFKSLYSPETVSYENIFIVAAPSDGESLKTSEGIIAGNYYLTGNRLSNDLSRTGTKDGFERFSMGSSGYGGKSVPLRLYPSNSPYEGEGWTTALLMPQALMDAAVKGSLPYFIYTVVALLALSLLASLLISRRYLRPVTDALDSIRSNTYDGQQDAPYLEISDLFEFLAQKDREHGEAIQKLDKEKQDAQAHYDRAQQWIERIVDKRMPEVDADSYKMFLRCLHTLTAKEREIFDLYLEGKSVKEIMEIANINQNTLKYHNKNIYSKLGVTSRKQLLEFAALMRHHREKTV